MECPKARGATRAARRAAEFGYTNLCILPAGIGDWTKATNRWSRVTSPGAEALPGSHQSSEPVLSAGRSGLKADISAPRSSAYLAASRATSGWEVSKAATASRA